MFVLPGRQLLVLQTVCCSSGPTQAVPPGSGSRRTVLLRTDTPPPQEALHSLHVDHSLNKQPAAERDGVTQRCTESEVKSHVLGGYFFCVTPGHDGRSQISVCVTSAQGGPPSASRQWRVLVLRPRSQEAEQELHGLQGS